MWRSLALIALVPVLIGCGPAREDPPVVPRIVETVVTKYVPVPDELSADCQNTAPKAQTYAEAKRLAIVRAEYLDECTARMRKIRALK